MVVEILKERIIDEHSQKPLSQGTTSLKISIQKSAIEDLDDSKSVKSISKNKSKK
jgi:hypothetical protein